MFYLLFNILAWSDPVPPLTAAFAVFGLREASVRVSRPHTPVQHIILRIHGAAFRIGHADLVAGGVVTEPRDIAEGVRHLSPSAGFIILFLRQSLPSIRKVRTSILQKFRNNRQPANTIPYKAQGIQIPYSIRHPDQNPL